MRDKCFIFYKKDLIWILPFMYLIASKGLYSSPVDYEKAYRYNELGIKAVKDKDYLRAIEYLMEAYLLLPDNEVVKKNLAVAYNNYGIQLAEKKEYSKAKTYLENAIELVSDPAYKKNLANILYSYAVMLYKEGVNENAIEQLEEAIKVDPSHKESYMLLGQIWYQKGDLHKARFYWAEVNKLFPRDDKLEEMVLRLDKEKYIEDSYKVMDIYYFDIRYDKEIVKGNEYELRSILKEARRDVGRDFRYYPKRKIPVIVYKRSDFDAIRNSPEWIAAIYDGKIRLPVPEGKFNPLEFTHIIWHEYTHVIVFDLTNGKCPIWINEGLAMFEESKKIKIDLTILRTAFRENTIIPLQELEEIFSKKNDLDKLRLAYLEAYTFIVYFLDRWNFYILKSLLEKIKEGYPLEEAFRQTVSKGIAQLEKEWREYLEDRF